MEGMNMARLYGLLPSKDWSLYNTTALNDSQAFASLGLARNVQNISSIKIAATDKTSFCKEIGYLALFLFPIQCPLQLKYILNT